MCVCIKGQRESEYNPLGKGERMNRVLWAEGTVLTTNENAF